MICLNDKKNDGLAAFCNFKLYKVAISQFKLSVFNAYFT